MKNLPFVIPLILMIIYVLNSIANNSEGEITTKKVNTNEVIDTPGITNLNNNTDSNFPLYSVKEGSVYDGDTLRVVSPNGDIKIRFACIDAKEMKQTGGIESRDFLRSLLKDNNNQVMVNETTKDRYGRIVAELYLPNGELIQEIQARNGTVFPYPKYKSDCPSWDKVEKAGAIAKKERLGVWNSNNPEYPWDWRKAKK